MRLFAFERGAHGTPCCMIFTSRFPYVEYRFGPDSSDASVICLLKLGSLKYAKLLLFDSWMLRPSRSTLMKSYGSA